MRLLALLLLPCLAHAVDITAREASDVGILIEITTDTNTDNVRIKYSDESAFLTTRYNAPFTFTATDKRLAVVGGFVPGDTIYLQIQIDTGSGYADYDCNSATVFDGTPDIRTSTAWTCHASGYIIVPLIADAGITPDAPDNSAIATLPTLDAGTTRTASSCADIQTDFDALKVLTGDGNADQIEIPAMLNWTDCPNLDLSTGRTNTDPIVITVDRWDDSRCPGPGERLNQRDTECYTTLAPSAIGRLMNLGGDTYINRLRLSAPPIGSSAYGEGGAISATADNGGNLDLTVTGHNFDASPDFVVVVADPDNISACTAQGIYQTSSEYALPDANTVRLVGQAGSVCPGGYVYQDPNVTQTGLIQWDTDWTGQLNQVVVSVKFPARHSFILNRSGASHPPSIKVVNSTIDWGNWIGQDNSGNPILSNKYPDSNKHLSVLGYIASANNILVRNNLHRGVGFGWFSDSIVLCSSNGTTGTDLRFQSIIHTVPKERVTTSLLDPNDGISGVVGPGRNHALEFKIGAEAEVRGLLYTNNVLTAFNGNSVPYGVYLRDNPEGCSDGDQRVEDWNIQSIAGYNVPILLGIEGVTLNFNDVGSVRGRIVADNLLLNQSDFVEDIGNGLNQRSGIIAEIHGEMTNTKISGWTKYKGSTNWAEIAAIGHGSRVQIEDFISLPASVNLWGKILMSNQTTNSEPAASVFTDAPDVFDATYNTFGSAVSYFRDGVLVCGHTGANRGSTNYAQVGLTPTQCTDQLTGVNYTLPHIKDYTLASPSTIQDAIDDVGCDQFFDCGNDGGLDEGHSGDEGWDGDQGRADIGLFGRYTGRTSVMEGVRVDDDTVRYYVRTPDTSSACTFEYRQNGSSGAWTQVTLSTGSRDRTADLSGSAGTTYEWELRCANAPDYLRGMAKPGS